MKVLYLFPDAREKLLERIIKGEAPTDRVYGLCELDGLGVDVCLYDSRPKGLLGHILNYFNKSGYVNIKSVSVLLKLTKCDVVVVVNDRFSTILTLVCKLSNTKIVYMDALFRRPKNLVKILCYKFNVCMSDVVILYSNYQVLNWSRFLNVGKSKFKVLPYTIDTDFYKATHNYNGDRDTKPFILSVGRDQARDYGTLVEAMDGLGVNLKIVSLPYLLKGIDTNKPWIEVLESIPYAELFELYSKALLVVLPLKQWGAEYPSGIRGLLEAKAFGKMIVASYSPILDEYFPQSSSLCYVVPENVAELRHRIGSLIHTIGSVACTLSEDNEILNTKYSMDAFAVKFKELLNGL